METNIPRASIHVGEDKKSFSAQVGNEAERRGWDEKRYQLKNAEEDKNNHYNFSRKHLNFEVTKGAKIVSLGSNPTPLHMRLQQRFDELGFKPYMDADHPGQVSKNTPNCVVNILFGGDHDVMKRLAFGDQELDTSDPNADQSDIVLMQAIRDWAVDTYKFACRKWGEENIIGFCVHCDETSIHAHVLTVPVEQVKKRGRIGNVYVRNDNPDVELTTKEWKALPKDERDNYTKREATKGMVERVSYAKVWGETRKDKSDYLTQLHTDYHNEVGCKYGLERGIPYEELSDEEKRERKHKDKVTLEAERKAKLAIEEAKQQKAEIEAETAIIQHQKDEAQKELKTAQSGFLAKIFQPSKFKKEEAEKIKDAYEAGAKETIESVVKASGLKWKQTPTAESFGQQYRMSWDSNRNLAKELKDKDCLISKKEAEIKELNVKVTKLTEEIDGLKFRLTLIDEDAVQKLRNNRIAEKTRADKAERELGDLRSAYENLSIQWNALWKEPEFNEAARKFKERKEREARLAEEARREAEAQASRRNSVLDKFISEGRSALRAFALTTRTSFTPKEVSSIYYGIMASASKHNLSLFCNNGIEASVKEFLSDMSWKDCSNFREECVCSWTRLFASKEVDFSESAINNFCAFVDHMSCSAETYVSLGGSNGCADQLTNWDGTQKQGLGAPEKKKGLSVS
ncbi:MAG: hypothetical protein KBT34_01760 [Prevotella sp.]|nr:hypothetical protein [Candidatus Prevotella equi]